MRWGLPVGYHMEASGSSKGFTQRFTHRNWKVYTTLWTESSTFQFLSRFQNLFSNTLSIYILRIVFFENEFQPELCWYLSKKLILGLWSPSYVLLEVITLVLLKFYFSKLSYPLMVELWLVYYILQKDRDCFCPKGHQITGIIRV